MKRFLIPLVMFILGCAELFSQTYFYQQESVVNEYGVKSKGNGQVICITFINNKGVCYPSDKNGNAENELSVYQFKGTLKNGVHLYTSVLKDRVDARNEASRNRPAPRSWIEMYAQQNQNVGNAYENGYYLGQNLIGWPSYKFSSDFSRLNINYTKGQNGQKPTEVYVRISSPNKSVDETMY